VGWVFGVQIWGSRVVELWRSVVCSLDSSGLGRWKVDTLCAHAARISSRGSYALFLIFSDAFCCPARCPLFYRTSVKGLRRLSVSVSDWDTAYMYGLYMSDGQWLWGHSAGVEVEVYDDVFLLCAFRVFMPRFRHVCVFVHISKYRT